MLPTENTGAMFNYISYTRINNSGFEIRLLSPTPPLGSKDSYGGAGGSAFILISNSSPGSSTPLLSPGSLPYPMRLQLRPNLRQ